MSTETSQYRLNLSNALHTISPALSALHTSRAAALHPEVSAILHTTHCPKCGTYRFSGDHPAYPPQTRKKRKSKCHLCGFSSDTNPSLNDSSVPCDSSTMPATDEIGRSSSTDTLAATVPTTTRAAVPSLPGRQAHSKSSHTKTSTLGNMLSRDRQREEGERAHNKRKEGHQGLAAFLKEL